MAFSARVPLEADPCIYISPLLTRSLATAEPWAKEVGAAIQKPKGASGDMSGFRVSGEGSEGLGSLAGFLDDSWVLACIPTCEP